MNLTIEIPDDIASRMAETGSDLARRALESLALEEFKNGHITKVELRRLLGVWDALEARRLSQGSWRV